MLSGFVVGLILNFGFLVENLSSVKSAAITSFGYVNRFIL